MIRFMFEDNCSRWIEAEREAEESECRMQGNWTLILEYSDLMEKLFFQQMEFF